MTDKPTHASSPRRRFFSGAALFLSLPLMIVLAGAWSAWETRHHRADSLVRAKVARVHADLRSIATAPDPAAQAATFHDPFSDGIFRTATLPGARAVYSVGPDQTDNHARLTYDATNGTVSPGDIITTVPLTSPAP